MNNYFSQFIPQIGGYGPNPYLLDDSNSSSHPQIQYISIFNPTLADERSESNEELYKQIICFISSKYENEHNLNVDQKVEQLRIVGLTRGVSSFASNFCSSKGENKTTIIKSSKSSLILFQLENDFQLACSISLVENKSKSNFVNLQLIKIIDTMHNQFVLSHTSLLNALNKYKVEALKDMLTDYWTGFISAYNNQYFNIPPGLVWPNSLNYKGFLGLIPNSHTTKRTYKKSSLSFSQSIKAEIDQILQQPYNEETESKIPKGVIVSCFNKSNIKKYGLIYSNIAFDKTINTEKFLKDSLIDIYNWLEFHDYHNKLETESLTSSNSKGLFSTNLEFPEVASDATSTMTSEEGTYSALDMLSPRNIASNLVILPLNYTVNSISSLGSQIKTIGIGSTLEESNVTERAGWLPVPSIFKSLSLGGGTAENEEQIPSNASLEGEEDDDEDSGHFLIGTKVNEFNHQKEIYRKLVYLNTNVSDLQGNYTQRELEYLLVVYGKDDIYITLVYDSSNPELDNVDFYEELAEDTLIPSINEINNSILGGSMMGGSVASLKSLKGILTTDDIDSDFFFVAYDGDEGSIKSSLPFLPIIKVNLDEPLNKSVVRYQSAIYYLHDQLASIFLMQSNKDFFSNNMMNEYFHKFTSNKLNDWMFYFIKHNNKYIIVIKNHNHNAKSAKRKSVTAIRAQSLVSSPATVASDPSNNIANNVNGPGLLNRITDGVADYAHLGFLDNLGDDVKYWLAGFTHGDEAS